MNKILLVLLVTAFICDMIPGQAKTVNENGNIVKVGQQAPDFTIKEAGVKSYKLSDLRGKVEFLQFTAS